MALELVGGAVLGAAVAELLKAVIDAKEKVTNLKSLLQRLESTLKSIIPRLNEIIRLNRKLDVPDEDMKELITLVQNGQEMVHKCSKISSINLPKKVKYSNKLTDLNTSLKGYFQTILPLDHFRNDKEVLFLVKEMHMKIVGYVKNDGGGTSDNNFVATTIKLFVKIPSKMKTIMIEVKTHETIQNVKTVIQTKEGIRPDKFSLFYDGKRLHDGNTLAYLNIKGDSTLHLVLKPRDVFLLETRSKI